MGKHWFNVILLLIAGCLNGSEEVRAFIEKMPNSERSIVDAGFRRFLQSFAGYVLYGDKPMCIEAFSLDRQPRLYYDEVSLSKDKLFEILQQWDLASVDREYLFLFTNYSHHKHLIIINRKLFIKTVNDNLSLFRYILGPKITAESLLSTLVDQQERFYDVIKDDVALLGILLGYGTHNSIAHRVLELSLEEKNNPILYFPFIKTPKNYQKLAEQLPTNVGSNSISRHVTFPIPCFGCDPDTEETKLLLATYENNRNQLIKVSEQEHFLESVLERIFTITSGEIKLPSIRQHSSSFDLTKPNDLLDNFAKTILAESQINEKNNVQFFIKGMRDSEENKEKAFSEYEIQSELIPLSTDIHDHKNLEQADLILSKLKKWTSLISQNVLYKTVKKGKGNPANAKTQSVTFHYSFHTSSNNEIKVGTIEQGNLETFIPGLAHLLIGMKKGEEREVYIHPRFAYGDRDPYPNEAILANIHLIDFIEGDREITIAPIQSLDSKQMWRLNSIHDEPSDKNKRQKPCGTSKALQAYYDKLQEQLTYLNGYFFWESIKTSDIPFSLDTLTKKIQDLQIKDMQEEERFSFILDYKAHQFHKRYTAGEIHITPFIF